MPFHPRDLLAADQPVVRVGADAVANLRETISCGARACRGALKLGLLGVGGARRFTLAPGRRAEVVVPLTARARRRLVARGRWAVKLWLLPEAHSMAGAMSRRITLTAPPR